MSQSQKRPFQPNRFVIHSQEQATQPQKKARRKSYKSSSQSSRPSQTPPEHETQEQIKHVDANDILPPLSPLQQQSPPAATENALLPPLLLAELPPAAHMIRQGQLLDSKPVFGTQPLFEENHAMTDQPVFHTQGLADITNSKSTCDQTKSPRKTDMPSHLASSSEATNLKISPYFSNAAPNTTYIQKALTEKSPNTIIPCRREPKREPHIAPPRVRFAPAKKEPQVASTVQPVSTTPLKQEPKTYPTTGIARSPSQEPPSAQTKKEIKMASTPEPSSAAKTKYEPQTQTPSGLTPVLHAKKEEIQQSPGGPTSASQLKPNPGPSIASQKHYYLAVAEAQKRRRAIIERIDHALDDWRPQEHGGKREYSIEAPAEKPLKVAQVTQQPDCSQTQTATDAGPILDPYQTAAIEAAMSGESFFLTGSAGTGKSFVLQEIIRRLRDKGKQVAVTASTGCAAVAIQGNTIHSVSGVGLGMEPMERLKNFAKTDRRLRKRLQNCDVLVIDEVSMIDSFLFEKVELVFRHARDEMDQVEAKTDSKRKIRRNVNQVLMMETELKKMFGGVQVITCGDFFQLPPVKASDPKFQMSSEKFFAFESKIWKKKIRKFFILRVVHRQSNRSFVGLLNELRYGKVSYSTKGVLDACRINPQAENTELDATGNPVPFTKLYSLRRQVDMENTTRLKRIKNQPGVRYMAEDKIHRKLDGMVLNSVKKLLQQAPAFAAVDLKQGCRVLCIKNVDKELGIVNGSSGYIVGFRQCGKARTEQAHEWLKLSAEEREKNYKDMSVDGLSKDEVVSLRNSEVMKKYEHLRRDETNSFMLLNGKEPDLVPVVRFDNGVTRGMIPEKWEIYGMRGQVIAVRYQIPLILGWALSIHKSQGMTLENVQTDLGRAFDYGQVYVALSRATSAHGLRVTSFNEHKVMSHIKVQEYYDRMDGKE